MAQNLAEEAQRWLGPLVQLGNDGQVKLNLARLLQMTPEDLEAKMVGLLTGARHMTASCDSMRVLVRADWRETCLHRIKRALERDKHMCRHGQTVCSCLTVLPNTPGLCNSAAQKIVMVLMDSALMSEGIYTSS